MLIVIPGHKPMSWNKLMRAHYRERMAWCEQVFAKIAEQTGTGNEPFSVPVEIEMTVYAGTRRLQDCDNLSSKCEFDALTKLGIIEDDSPAYVASVTKMSKYDRDNPRTEIKITPKEH